MGTFKVRKYRNVLYAIHAHNYQTTKVSTGLSIDDKYWKNNQLSKNFPFYNAYRDTIETTLNKLRAAVFKVEALGLPLTTNNVRNAYFEARPKELPISYDFFKDTEQFIEMKRSVISENSIRNYRYTFQLLKDFEDYADIKLDADTYNNVVFTKFVSYMILERELMDNTVNKHVRMLKSFLHFMYPKMDIYFMKYPEYDPEVIVLTRNELKVIQQSVFNDRLSKVRDLFLFICYTGMRYSDTQRYESRWVNDGVFEFMMKKTKYNAIVPIIEQAKEIICAYEGTPKISAQKFNKYLKEMFKELKLDRSVLIKDRIGNKVIETIKPLYEVITSHIGRKTFITYLLERGIPIQDVMVMSGHVDYREIRKYIKISREHIRESLKDFSF